MHGAVALPGGGVARGLHNGRGGHRGHAPRGRGHGLGSLRCPRAHRDATLQEVIQMKHFAALILYFPRLYRL